MLVPTGGSVKLRSLIHPYFNAWCILHLKVNQTILGIFTLNILVTNVLSTRTHLLWVWGGLLNVTSTKLLGYFGTEKKCAFGDISLQRNKVLHSAWIQSPSNCCHSSDHQLSKITLNIENQYTWDKKKNAKLAFLFSEAIYEGWIGY